MRLLSPQLVAFLAIVKLKTVHAAAEQLHLTQTAVTQRIRSLEIKLKTCLFVRSRRGMLLTKEGEALLRFCNEAQELEGLALSGITGTGTETLISICLTGPTTILRARIIPQCLKVMHDFPRLLMHFDMNDNENSIQSLRQGESQLAIISPNLLSDEMEHKELKPEQYILVASPKWKNRRLREILKNERIIDFNPQDQMTFDYLKYFQLDEDIIRDRHFCNNTDALARLISAGIGFSVLPLEFAKTYLTNKELIILNAGKSYPQPLVLAWFPRHQYPKYFSALINACN